jgi:hypothetical protein
MNDENSDLVSEGKEFSVEGDEGTVETPKKKVSNINQIKVTRTKMKHLKKIKQLHSLQDQAQTERPDKLHSPVANKPQLSEAPDSLPTEPVATDLTVSDLIDPTVLPPQDEFISKQTTTEDVTTLLTSAEDFGSTKDIPQALLHLGPMSVCGTPSESLISLLSDSTESEYLLSTTESGETVSEVQTSGSNGAVIPDSDSVITIISISDDSVMSVGSIAADTSLSDDSPDVSVAVLESTETGDMIAKAVISDIHHESHNNAANNKKAALNMGGPKQVLVKVSDLKGKETLMLKKRVNLRVSKGEETKLVGLRKGL